MATHRRIDRSAGVVIAPILLLASVAGCGGTVAFDTTRWQAERGNATGESARGAMVSQFESAGIKVGASRARVMELLGPADASDAQGDLYFLGRGAYAPDYETLTIKYGGDGQVIAIDRRQS